MNKLLPMFLAAGLLVVLGAWAATRFYMSAPLQTLSESVDFVVEDGASLSSVSRGLEEQGVISWPRVFSLWGRLNGDAHRVQAGEYVFEPGSSPRSILAQLVEGRVKLYPVTILEGWTYREVLAALRANSAVRSTIDPQEATTLDFIGAEYGGGKPEGWFYPETYLVPRGTIDSSLLQQAHELMQTRLESAWSDRDDDLPLASPYELLTLASIIERETAVDDERARVAGVFIRRLNKKMRLQTDPTVIYGLGEDFDGNLTRRDLLTDTPYNTYTRSGLPPTPIGMPSEASLLAAAHPEDGDELYFVATGEGDGRHVFSATLEEHNAAVAAYISRLRQASRARRSAGGAAGE
jgi:UPF0755 protein